MSPQSARTAIAFVFAARRYWISVFPVARREIRGLRQRARCIPDPVLRSLALDAQQRKWASLEGAAAFATFAPRTHCSNVARLLVDLQGIFDYADTLMEQPADDPVANARQLHLAFLAALQPDLAHSDYYRHHSSGDDGNYLTELADVCRTLIHELPAYTLVAEAVVRHAWRVVFYQSEVNLATIKDYPHLSQWARRQTSGTELNWWELAAACGSSLAIFAHVAAAADPTLTSREVHAIEDFYWPWVEALHILLDSLVDRAEDRETNQPNLLDHYTSDEEMAERFGLLANEAIRRSYGLAPHHRLILVGMIALYLSDEQAWIATARPASEQILDAAGTLADPALLMLRTRRLVSRP